MKLRYWMIPMTFPSMIRRRIAGTSVLDVGCGYGKSPNTLSLENAAWVGLDRNMKSLKAAKASGSYRAVVAADAAHLPFKSVTFDTVMGLDILEHTDRVEGHRLIAECDRVAKRSVIISTPVGFLERQAETDNEFMAHRSGWLPKELRALGFRVRGQGLGRVYRHVDRSNSARYPAAFLLSLVSYLLQPFVYFVPRLGAHQVCTKIPGSAATVSRSKLTWARLFAFGWANIVLGITALLLVSLWFASGKTLAYAEGGFPFYNPAKSLAVTSDAWYEFGLGTTAPQILASLPFYILVTLLEQVGIPAVVVQALFFFSFLVAGGVSISGVTGLSTKPPAPETAKVSAGLFYILNPFAMAAIWNRFLLTSMFFYALLPLSLYVTQFGMSRKRLKYALYVPLLSGAFAFSFTMPAFIVTFWIAIGGSILFKFAISPDRTERRFLSRYAALLLAGWVGINSWWLLPLGSLALIAPASVGTDVRGDVGTLLAVSPQMNPLNTMRLIYPYYLYQANPWSPLYTSLAFQLLSFSIPILVFSAPLFYRKTPAVLFLSLLSLTGIFLSNGSAFPLGVAFLWVYEHVSEAGVFRNPLETLGLLILVGYAPLFGLSLVGLEGEFVRRVRIAITLRRTYDHSETSVSKALVGLVLILVCGVSVAPLWTGSVFTTNVPPANNPFVGYKTSVPDYYARASEFLEKNAGDYRTIILPITSGGITMNWEYGYAGGDARWQLVGTPVISQSLGPTPERQIVSGLQRALVGNADGFWKFLAITHSKFLVIERDFNYSARAGEIDSITSADVLENSLQTVFSPSLVNSQVNISSLYVTGFKRCPGLQSNLSWAWVDSQRGNYTTWVSSEGGPQDQCSVVVSGFPIFAPFNPPSTPYVNNLGVLYSVPSAYSDWSGARYLEVWMKSNRSNRIVVQAMDNNGSLMNWDQRFQTLTNVTSSAYPGWQLHLLPIGPRFQLGNFDMHHVARVLLSEISADRRLVTFEIGSLFVDHGTPSGVPQIQKVTEIGKLVLYALKDAYHLPIVYGARSFINRQSNSDLSDTILSPGYLPGRTTILDQNTLNSLYSLGSLPSNGGAKPVDLITRKTSPSSYTTRALNVTSPFILVLGETYNPWWRVSINGQDVLAARHFVADGYANGWLVEELGNFTIGLTFALQSILTIGEVTSATAVLSLTVLPIAVIYARKHLKKGDVND